jgi:hypothetical protein
LHVLRLFAASVAFVALSLAAAAAGAAARPAGALGTTALSSAPTAPSSAPAAPSSAPAAAPALYGSTASSLYAIDLASLAVRRIGDFGFEVTDIALAPDGTLFGCTFRELLRIDKAKGRASAVGSFSVTVAMNSLAVGADGTIYGADDQGSIFKVDRATGRAKRIGIFGRSFVSSGDLTAGPNALIYAAVTTSPGVDVDRIAVLHPGSGEVRILGKTGYAGVYGLASAKGMLVGFTEGGEAIRIDPRTGKASAIGRLGPAFWGATSAPER